MDFTREMVLAGFMGQQNSGGYAIEVTGVKADNRALTAYVRRTSPPPGGVSIQVLTHPFCFAAVKKSNLPVKFVGAPK